MRTRAHISSRLIEPPRTLSPPLVTEVGELGREVAMIMTDEIGGLAWVRVVRDVVHQARELALLLANESAELGHVLVGLSVRSRGADAEVTDGIPEKVGARPP